MDDDTTGDDRLAHLSDKEWADAILDRARERLAVGEHVGAMDDPLEDLIPFETSGRTGAATFPDEPVVGSRPDLVTREEVVRSSQASGDADWTPSTSFPDSVVRTPPDLGIPGAQKGLGRAAVEWGVVIVGALVIALLVKAFLFQAYYIPSPSMEPTLSQGDRIVVNKLSYRLHDVNRGDLVVFKAPEGTGGVDDLIKRVVALPGEFVRFADGRVLINKGMLLEPYLPLQEGTVAFPTPINCANLPGDTDGCRVPPGHVFVLGDHRDNSRDSRFFGPISEDSIRGRAFLRIWPLGEVRRL